MREIEIKVRLTDRERTLQQLADRGVVLGKTVKQHDVVYGQRRPGDDQWGDVWLRIRTENDQTVLFTLKMNVTSQLDSIEHELEVSSAQELEAIIKLLGFERYSDLTKIRAKGHAGTMEICVDTLPELGEFLEVERLEAHDADHETVLNELWQFLHELGLSDADQIHDGYDVLMRRQNLV